jgi:hypothetical protein
MDELERIKKEKDYSRKIFRIFLEGLRETTTNLNKKSLCPDRVSNSAPLVLRLQRAR